MVSKYGKLENIELRSWDSLFIKFLSSFIIYEHSVEHIGASSDEK